MTEIYVTKRDGTKEKYQPNKINQVVEWACEGLDVSASEILMKMSIQLIDGISTQDIQNLVIKSAADLISEFEPDYQYAAARLLIYDIRKQAYGKFEVPKFYDHIVNCVNEGRYDKEILEKFSKEEIEYLETFIDQNRDFLIAFAGVETWKTKYLVQDRVTKKIYESPQFALMLIAMCLHQEEKTNRDQHIIDFYNEISTFGISLPTPIMSGVRTPTRQFSSCVLVEVGDTEDSIFDAVKAVGKYTAKRAGIGLNLGAIRAMNSPIRNGEAKHAGLIGITKMYQETLGWVSQGGNRKGSMTVFYPIWHRDIQDLLVLKNNRGTEDTRARHIDYGFQFNKLIYQRLIDSKNVSLFSPDVANGKLLEYFYSDTEKFIELYCKLEKDKSVVKKSIPAIELFILFAQERRQTGRIYLQNIDHSNDYGVFNSLKAPIKQSNLCLEVTLPTQYIGHPDEEIALCTLAAYNLGKLIGLSKSQMYTTLEKLSRSVVRALDNLLDYQDYPVRAALKNKKRRTLGIGVIDYAHWLASLGLKYSDGSANNATHELFEAIRFFTMKASVELAKERGSCELFSDLDLQKIIPVYNYKKEVDLYHTANLQLDWQWLKDEIEKFGIRNSTVLALMPSETSSIISNSTNGIEPPREYLTIKSSSNTLVKQVVPDVKKLYLDYELKWEQPNPEGYLILCGIMQKFVDQAISVNTPYDPSKFEDGKVPIELLIKHYLLAYKIGLKTLYYDETRDGNDQSDCESCKI